MDGSSSGKKRKAGSPPVGEKKKEKGDDAPATATKRKANPAFAERKKRQKERVFTGIKTGMQKLCRDNAMNELLQLCVCRCSIIACESSLLASFHTVRLLESGEDLPVMDYTFFNQCVSTIANMGGNRTCEQRNPSLVQSLVEYRMLQPEGYVPVERLPCMAQMLVMVAQQARENFAVSTDQTLLSRMARWFRLKIKQHSQQATATTYFEDNESHVIKSIISVLTRASTEAPFSVEGLVAKYTRFRLEQYPIPQVELTWMQDLCDEVRGRIGPLPLRVKQHPELHLPFLYSMLKDLEGYNQQLILKGSDERPFKLFSLLPQKKVRPINIKINNTVLAGLNKYLKTGVQLEGQDLWEYFFKTNLVTRSKRRKFEQFMVTDGMSATLIVSRPKSAVEEVSKNEELERVIRLFNEADRVVAVDPGRNPILTAVVHNQAAMDSLMATSPKNVKHEVLTWGKKQFYQESGSTHRSKVVSRAL